jgi:hypothetical protein
VQRVCPCGKTAASGPLFRARNGQKSPRKRGLSRFVIPLSRTGLLRFRTLENGRDSDLIRINPKSAVLGFGNCCRWLCGVANPRMVCHPWSNRARPCHRRRMIRIKTAGQKAKKDPRKRLFPGVFPSCHSRKFPVAWRVLQRFEPPCAAVNDCGWLSKIGVRSFPLNDQARPCGAPWSHMVLPSPPSRTGCRIIPESRTDSGRGE